MREAFGASRRRRCWPAMLQSMPEVRELLDDAAQTPALRVVAAGGVHGWVPGGAARYGAAMGAAGTAGARGRAGESRGRAAAASRRGKRSWSSRAERDTERRAGRGAGEQPLRMQWMQWKTAEGAGRRPSEAVMDRASPARSEQ